jgi:c-di-GMP-binding flagellar brake protein YcgR
LIALIKSVLQVGDKIEVVTNYGHASKEKSSYSLVQDIPDNSSLLITLPMAAGHSVMLEPGQIVRINFFRSDGEFYFSARVVERIKLESFLLVRIVQVSPLERLQRRNFFRFKTILPVLFRFVENNEPKSIYYKGHAKDISGGGIRLYTEKFIPISSHIECKIKMDNAQEIVLNGKVLRVRKVQDAEKQYDIGICFVDIPEKIRDRIISFIFEEQRQLRQKGEI